MCVFGVITMSGKNRGCLKIVADILDVVGQGASKTRIKRKANLSSKLVAKYLTLASEAGLVRFDEPTEGDKKRRVPKSKLRLIYDKAKEIYEKNRIAFGDKQGASYGANKTALEKTQKEIKSLFDVKISLKNLQEAIRRRARPPLRVGKE